jgi:hypothetical protein
MAIPAIVPSGAVGGTELGLQAASLTFPPIRASGFRRARDCMEAAPATRRVCTVLTMAPPLTPATIVVVESSAPGNWRSGYPPPSMRRNEGSSMSKPCAYCGSQTIGKVALKLGGHPACESCHAYFGEDADRERLARIRSYRVGRRGLLSRLLPFGRG